jgi:transcriptional regulator with XRE-family HTH domain
MREAHEIIASRVGQRLRELRAGLTQAEFAARLGVTQTQYHRYETGKRLAPDRLLQAVAQLKGLSADEVAWGQAPPAAAVAPPSPGDSLGQAVAHLVSLLDRQSLEDLYYFLKRKAQDQAARQRRESKQAQAALETLRKAAM